MRYEDFISQRDLLGADWKSDSAAFEAGVGIAIVCAYMKGVKPAIEDMAYHLDIPVNILAEPFKRLLYSGVFSKSFNARQDTELLERGVNPTNTCMDGVTPKDIITNAWCIIGGIGNGMIFRSMSKVVNG